MGALNGKSGRSDEERTGTDRAYLILLAEQEVREALRELTTTRWGEIARRVHTRGVRLLICPRLTKPHARAVTGRLERPEIHLAWATWRWPQNLRHLPAVIRHEVAHLIVAYFGERGHGPEFVRIAKALGGICTRKAPSGMFYREDRIPIVCPTCDVVVVVGAHRSRRILTGGGNYVHKPCGTRLSPKLQIGDVLPIG